MSRLAVPAVVAALGVVVLVAAFAALMLVRGCLWIPDASRPQPVAPPPPPATSREILVDLTKWDAATSAARRAAAEDVARRMPDFALLRLETFACGGQTHEVAIYMHAKTGMEFVLVPGGKIVMGSPATETDRRDHETQHAVTLSMPFMIARTPCTEAAYRKVVGLKPSTQLPAVKVSWDDVESFCRTAGLELPSEAQWECACRAGTNAAFCFGDEVGLLDEYAWYFMHADGQTHPVAQKKANAFGLYDVHGNVEQWCHDWYGEYEGRAVIDPRGPLVATARVIRGGGFQLGPDLMRCASRSASAPENRFMSLGFRPAKTVPLE